MTFETEQQKLFEELNALEQQFESVSSLDDSVEKMASDFMNLILLRERARRGVSNMNDLWPVVDAETLAAMAAWDTNDPRYVLAEKALRRFTKGRGEDAVNLLDASITSKQEDFSKAQSQRAKAVRPKRPLAKIIKQIVTEDPSIDEHKLLQKLKRLCGAGVLKQINDEIHFEDPDILPMKVKGLKDQLSRAKKKHSR